ncbi:MMPL family transporter [Actinoplanes sp. N902-109]|uniref:MMPL family transporter n=1 Tax=Actinoplanes sp. (strain N902-109) TaxID=649831 RepID=UPI00032959E6|nr:MMPL family transporter [Actinoplanes sp. N902-109]AGL16015.1 MMPL domain-containing protein [Actinoplanes sp. N902-109]
MARFLPWRRRTRPVATDRFAVWLRRLRWPVVLGWLLLTVFLSPVGDKLGTVTNDTPASYLPKSASSTRVAEIDAAAAGGKDKPQTDDMIVVVERKGGLTAQDSTTVTAIRAAVNGLAGTVDGLSAPGDVTVSDDKQAAVFGATVTASQKEISEKDIDAVKAVRDAVGKAAGSAQGLTVAVTGAAASTADSGENTETDLLLTGVVIVGVVLLLVYRSPVLWLFPLIGAIGAINVGQALAYGVASAGFTVSSLSSYILIVLIFGAGCDYALLLTHRYREELSRHALPEEAMAETLRRTFPTLLASAGTVMAGMLCLLAAGSGALRSLGPVGVVGIFAALIAQITFTPALFLLFGRVIFWPLVPRQGKQGHEESRVWSRIGQGVSRRPRLVSALAVVALLAACAGLFSLKLTSDPLNNVRGNPGSVVGSRVLGEHFPVGISYPLQVLTPPEQANAALAVAKATPNVASAEQGEPVQGWSSIGVVLSVSPFGDKSWNTIKQLRADLAGPAPGALVGGYPAVQYDSQKQAQHDAMLVIPLVLLVILLVIALLLRAVVAPVVLVLTTALSFAAAFGLSSLLWDKAFGFAGIDPSIPIYIFVFLVALGVDYNIFLGARIREESRRMGTPRGTLHGLSVTGGVITAAGIVLAASFAALAQLPSVQLTEIGTSVALGIMLDTLLVRTVLVPASILILGEKSWWPSRPKPLTDAAPEPAAGAAPEPAAGAAPEPAAGATPEPAAGATPEPAAGAAPEPAAGSAADPAAASARAAVAEPTAKTVAQPDAEAAQPVGKTADKEQEADTAVRPEPEVVQPARKKAGKKAKKKTPDQEPEKTPAGATAENTQSNV